MDSLRVLAKALRVADFPRVGWFCGEPSVTCRFVASPLAMGVGRRARGAAVSDRPSRNEQRRARALAAQEGLSYQQALTRLRHET